MFQRGKCLSSKGAYEKTRNVSDTTVSTGLVLLKGVTRGYERCYILHMDETAYSYCANPSSAITRDRTSCRKQFKRRLTVTVACSANGSSLKLPLFFVGTVWHPRFVELKSAKNLDLYYGNSPEG